MINKIKLITLFLLISNYLVANDSIFIEAKIKTVTVFLRGAQVKGEANVNLKKGVNLLVFKNLPKDINVSSFQVKTNYEVTILSILHRINYMQDPKKPENIKKLNESNDTIKERIKDFEQLISIYTTEEKIITDNINIGGSERNPNTEELQAASNFIKKRLLEIKLKKLAISKKIKSYKKQLQQNTFQLKTYSNSKGKQASEIYVTVSSPLSKKYKFNISYNIRNASWRPIYDFRVENVSKPLQIIYKAAVKQHTTIDWENVKLIISTGNPDKPNIKPELQANYLKPQAQFSGNKRRNSGSGGSNKPIDLSQLETSYYAGNTLRGVVYDIQSGDPIPGVSIVIKGTSTGTVTDIDGRFQLNNVPDNATHVVISFIGMKTIERPLYSVGKLAMEADNVSLDEVVVTAYGTKRGIRQSKTKKENKKEEEKLVTLNVQETRKTATTLEYVLDKSYTILSNNREYTVDLQKQKTDATYLYESVPKLDLSAFLTAKLPNWEQLNLMNGTVNFFLENTYVGSSNLNSKQTVDTLNISLGRDNSVLIKRKTLSEFNKRQFIGSKKLETYAFEISVRNNKNADVNIIIEDQIPISNHKDIDVEILENSKAKYDEDTGELKWDLKLKPNETKKLIFKYSIKYPKKSMINH